MYELDCHARNGNSDKTIAYCVNKSKEMLQLLHCFVYDPVNEDQAETVLLNDLLPLFSERV